MTADRLEAEVSAETRAAAADLYRLMNDSLSERLASLATGGPVADGVRAVGLIVVAMVGALVVFVAAVFAVGILAQRQPPYPM
jgi:hypothetical protein